MLTPEQIREKAERKYPDFLRSLVSGNNVFPLRIRFGKPASDMDFATLKEATEALAAGNFGYTIEYEARNTRRWGTQQLPAQVRFDTDEQFVGALGKHKEVAAFKQHIAAAQTRIPTLRSWLASHAKWVVDYSDDWDGLLAVCEYFLADPRPNLYIRQLPIPVHTKFIKEHSEVLTSMLLAILPQDAKHPDGRNFEAKFGLKPLEEMVRFRALDPDVARDLHLTDPRMGLPLDRFRALPAACLTVIITENLMTLECLPTIPKGLGIFGQGRAVALLEQIPWFNQCRVLYWGDIDEHGLQILAGLRNSYPHVQSLMMDIATLEELRHLCGKGEPAGVPPHNLTPSERTVYDEVAKNKLRLEQEKIPLDYSNEKILAAAANRQPS